MIKSRVLIGATALAIFSTISLVLSYLKFARCIDIGWNSPEVYQRYCYTDIASLYDSRGFSRDLWPYGSGSDSLEYPILSGVGIWLISLLTKNGAAGLHQFFSLNLLALSCTYLLTVFFLYRSDKRKAILFALSPAVIATLFINWDMWGILPLIGALIAFHNRRFITSGVLLAVSISFKFFPIILVLPTLIALRKDRENLKKFTTATVLTTIGLNLPFAIMDFAGWSKFYIFNFHRGVDFGSIWYLIALSGHWINHVNEIVTPLVLFLIGICLYRFRDNYDANIYLVTIIFFSLNKVYSPQYVLWLTAITVVVIPMNRWLIGLYLLWQLSEVAYNIVIWRHILDLDGAPGAISVDGYIWVSALRYVALFIFTAAVIRLLENNLVKSSGSKANV